MTCAGVQSMECGQTGASGATVTRPAERATSSGCGPVTTRRRSMMARSVRAGLMTCSRARSRSVQVRHGPTPQIGRSEGSSAAL